MELGAHQWISHGAGGHTVRMIKNEIDNLSNFKTIIHDSVSKPVLQVIDLKVGVYKFNLTVCDKQNACDSTIATLEVIVGEYWLIFLNNVPKVHVFHENNF